MRHLRILGILSLNAFLAKNMAMRRRKTLGLLAGFVLLPCLFGYGPERTWAVEVGERAPDFKLPSTMGGDVSLSDFRGKKWVLLEFYGADFAPT